jgi:hypothetical protein
VRLTISILVIFLILSSALALEVEWNYVSIFGERPQCVLQTEDEGFLIVGERDGIWITRLDRERNLIWNRRYTLEPWYCDVIKLLKNTSGTYTVVGFYDEIFGNQRVDTDLFLFEVNDDGDSLNYREFELEGYTNISDAIVASDDNYMITFGRNFEINGREELHVLRVDEHFEIISDIFIQRPYPGTEINCIIEADENEFIVGGSTWESIDGQDILVGCVWKIDSEGNITTRKPYEFIRNGDDFEGVRTCFNHKYALWWTNYPRGFCLVINDDCDSLTTINTGGYYTRSKKQFIAYGDEDIIFSGTFDNNQDEVPDSLRGYRVLCLYNENGDSLESLFWHPDSVGHGSRYFPDIITTSEGGVLILASKYVNPTGHRWQDKPQIIKILPRDGAGIFSASNRNRLPIASILNPTFPNPFNSSVILSFSIFKVERTCLVIYDTEGRLLTTIFDGYLTPDNYIFNWSPVGVPSGVYFVRLSSNSNQSTVPIQYVP